MSEYSNDPDFEPRIADRRPVDRRPVDRQPVDRQPVDRLPKSTSGVLLAAAAIIAAVAIFVWLAFGSGLIVERHAGLPAATPARTTAQ